MTEQAADATPPRRVFPNPVSFWSNKYLLAEAERDVARAELTAARLAQQEAERQRDAWHSKFDQETRIVDNVWGALNISTYEQAHGKDIATLVSEQRQLREAAESRLTEAHQRAEHFERTAKMCGEAADTWAEKHRIATTALIEAEQQWREKWDAALDREDALRVNVSELERQRDSALQKATMWKTRADDLKSDWEAADARAEEARTHCTKLGTLLDQTQAKLLQSEELCRVHHTQLAEATRTHQALVTALQHISQIHSTRSIVEAKQIAWAALTVASPVPHQET